MHNWSIKLVLQFKILKHTTHHPPCCWVPSFRLCNTQALQSAFTALMTADPELVKAQCTLLIARLQAKADSADGAKDLSARDSLVLRLHSQYEGDVGVLSSYFLNMVGIWPCISLFLGVPQPVVLTFIDRSQHCENRGVIQY